MRVRRRWSHRHCSRRCAAVTADTAATVDSVVAAAAVRTNIGKQFDRGDLTGGRHRRTLSGDSDDTHARMRIEKHHPTIIITVSITASAIVSATTASTVARVGSALDSAFDSAAWYRHDSNIDGTHMGPALHQFAAGNAPSTDRTVD